MIPLTRSGIGFFLSMYSIHRYFSIHNNVINTSILIHIDHRLLHEEYRPHTTASVFLNSYAFGNIRSVVYNKAWTWRNL